MHVAVVGSGPAGYFCAKALSERGVRVTILDVGKELDVQRRDQVAMLAETPRDQWQPEMIRALSENPMVTAKGVPRKLLFGSDFAYQFTHPFAQIDNPDLFPSPTFAKGGYSMMWGGAALPACDSDIADWPIKRQELTTYYQKVLQTVPLCGGEGTLDDAFPAWTEALGELYQGAQGRRLLKDLAKSKEWLRSRGVLYGPARLAVHADPSTHSSGCNSCGFCLSGCPRNAIFSTPGVLDDLCHSGLVEYRRNTIVHRVAENNDQVNLTLIDEATGARREETYDSVFLAAGVMNTTRIILASRELYNRTVTLKESQKFLLPVFRLKGDAEALTEKQVTLASVFIEANIPELSKHWLHVQMSPMNDMVMNAMGVDPLAPPSLRRMMLTPVLKRMMIAWCGLHSDHGDRIEVKLLPPGEDEFSTLHVRGHHSEEGRRMVWRVARKLFMLGLRTQTMFLPYPQFSEPGRATHCGAAFPMREKPKGELDSDVFGRPFGWKNIFAVDSSIFPSVPGTTIAFNIMANAYRIGATAPLHGLDEN